MNFYWTLLLFSTGKIGSHHFLSFCFYFPLFMRMMMMVVGVKNHAVNFLRFPHNPSCFIFYDRQKITKVEFFVWIMFCSSLPKINVRFILSKKIDC